VEARSFFGRPKKKKILIDLFTLLFSLFVNVPAAGARTDIGAGTLNGDASEVH
jgi:hypothetical protein